MNTLPYKIIFTHVSKSLMLCDRKIFNIYVLESCNCTMSCQSCKRKWTQRWKMYVVWALVHSNGNLWSIFMIHVRGPIFGVRAVRLNIPFTRWLQRFPFCLHRYPGRVVMLLISHTTSTSTLQTKFKTLLFLQFHILFLISVDKNILPVF